MLTAEYDVELPTGRLNTWGTAAGMNGGVAGPETLAWGLVRGSNRGTAGGAVALKTLRWGLTAAAWGALLRIKFSKI